MHGWYQSLIPRLGMTLLFTLALIALVWGLMIEFAHSKGLPCHRESIEYYPAPPSAEEIKKACILLPPGHCIATNIVSCCSPGTTGGTLTLNEPPLPSFGGTAIPSPGGGAP